MRIGLSTSVIGRGKTGIGQYVFALVRALLAQGSAHRFVLFVLEEDQPLFDFAKDRLELVTVPEEFRPAAKDILWHQPRLPHLTRTLGLGVLHVPSYRRMLWRKPCPLVATIHDLAPFRVRGKYDWKRMFYGKVVARQLARRQDAIIAISENTARDIRQFFSAPAARMTVIHNGIEHVRFCPGDTPTSKSVVAKRFNLTKPFFLYVARLEHPGKNHVRLIEAFTQFKSAVPSDWQLALAGSDWHGAEMIHAAIKASPAAADIRALGFVGDPDLPELYRAADGFVFPSLYEGFGLPPIEAMACGCPVISSTRGSLGEVIGTAALTIDPENVADIAAKLGALAGDAAARTRLRVAGFDQARKFDWQNTARQTLEIYERVAKKPGG